MKTKVFLAVALLLVTGTSISQATTAPTAVPEKPTLSSFCDNSNLIYMLTTTTASGDSNSIAVVPSAVECQDSDTSTSPDLGSVKVLRTGKH